MASAMPVLPEVASITVCPGLSAPRASASSISAMARRSFTEESGLKNSHLAYSVTLDGASRWMRTMGVRPMVPRMLSWIMRIPRLG